MTIEQLRIFIAVAQRLHVTRAAEDLGLTQSGASAAVAALEARYGLSLFHRIGRRIELTAAGRAFLPAAQAVLAQTRAAETCLSELVAMRRGSLSLYSSQTVSNYWLPARVAEFHRRYPQIQLQIHIGNTTQVANAVLDGSADLGFAEGSVEEPALEQTEIAGDRLVLVLSPGHPWVARRKIDLRELTQIPWVLREKGSGTRRVLEDAFRKLGIDIGSLSIALELPSNEAVMAAVEAGAGATVVSQLVLKHRDRLRAVDIGLAPRFFRILRHRERFQTTAEKAMISIAAEDSKPAQNVVAIPSLRAFS